MNMKLHQIILALVITIVSLHSLKAQEVWSLRDCIDYAIDNNLTVKRQELSAEIAEKNFNQSKINLLPNLNVRGEHYYNAGKAINYETYQYVNENFQGGSVNLSSEVNLFNGLQNFNNIKKSKLDLMVQLENVEKAKNDITLNITTAYLQILLNKELVDNAKEQLEVTLEQIEKTKKLVEIGNAAKGDLLQIQAQAAVERADLTNKENNLKIAYLDLTQLLNLESTEDFEIEFPLIPDITSEENYNVAEVYDNALEILPEIKGARLQVESSKKNLAISKGQLSPTLSAGYQYGSRYNELTNKIEDATVILSESPTGVTESGENIFNYMTRNIYASDYPYIEQINDNANHMLYASLRIPIFNRWQNKTAIEQAKINLADSKLNLDLQKQNVYKNIQQAQAQATAALERYKANLESAQSMAEAFRYTEQKYEVGMVDIIEYKSAKNEYNIALSNVSQAKYEFIFRKKILEFYKGEQIEL
ncbi:MAG: TolC family protein [Bacteroidota bacterium]|nr:TolC family protein [Bacteroidota bacterium]